MYIHSNKWCPVYPIFNDAVYVCVCPPRQVRVWSWGGWRKAQGGRGADPPRPWEVQGQTAQTLGQCLDVWLVDSLIYWFMIHRLVHRMTYCTFITIQCTVWWLREWVVNLTKCFQQVGGVWWFGIWSESYCWEWSKKCSDLRTDY